MCDRCHSRNSPKADEQRGDQSAKSHFRMGKDMRKVFALFVFSMVLIGPALALNLNELQKPLYYECYKTHEAGLYKNKSTDEIQSGRFNVDPRDKWRLTIARVRSPEDLIKYNCTKDRIARKGFGALWDEGDPEFCIVQTFFDGRKSISRANHCKILIYANDEGLKCGPADSFYFDSDRLYGLEASDSVYTILIDPIISLTVKKFKCQRLDR